MGKRVNYKKRDKGAFAIVSIKVLSEQSGISYQRIYDNINGVYNTLSMDEKTILANTLHDQTVELYKYLGFRHEIKRVK